MTDDMVGGGRFRVRILPGAEDVVEKCGSPEGLAREAAALAVLAGAPGVPRVVRHDAGLLLTTRLPGSPRRVSDVSPAGLRALGALLRTVHHAAHSPVAGPPGDPSPATGADAYARRRAAEAGTAAASAGLVLAPCPVPPCAGPPFRPVHGDLTGGNVVWDGDRPSLVDWEFWHWGDPAEDLAYLAEANGLSDGALRHVLDGHGTDAGGRVDGWRPVVLREIASWWVAEGRGDLALPHLRRLGVSPPTAPSGRTPPGASAPPA